MSKLDSFGKVFYPNYEKDVIQGAKLYSNEKETIIEFDFPSLHIPNKPEIILGEFTGIGPITCIDNELYGLESGQGGTRCKYKVAYLLTGILFPRKEDIKFNIAVFQVNSLAEWFNIRTIKQSLFPAISIEFGPDQKINFDINGFKKASFYFTYSYKSKKYSVNVSEQVTLSLTTLEPETLDYFYNIVIMLKKLFSFLSNTRLEIDDISLYCHQQNILPEIKSDSLIKIKLFDQKQTISPCPTSEFLSIKYIDVKESFISLLTKWICLSKDNIVIDLLMEKAYNQELSNKTYFLNVCFALEVYHKNRVSNQKLSIKEFKKIKDYLKKNVKDPDAIDWINNKMGLGNQPSFRDRLSYFKNDMETIYYSDIETLINKIIYTRNSLVHSSTKSQYVVNDEFELHIISITLETVIKGAILKDLGIEQENRIKIYSEAKKYIDRIIKSNESQWVL